MSEITYNPETTANEEFVVNPYLITHHDEGSSEIIHTCVDESYNIVGICVEHETWYEIFANFRNTTITDSGLLETIIVLDAKNLATNISDRYKESTFGCLIENIYGDSQAIPVMTGNNSFSYSDSDDSMCIYFEIPRTVTTINYPIKNLWYDIHMTVWKIPGSGV